LQKKQHQSIYFCQHTFPFAKSTKGGAAIKIAAFCLKTPKTRDYASSPPFFTLKAVSFPAKVAFLAIFTSDYSTVTLFAKFLGWSTLLPRKVAIW
jgi:hypothetical protein